MEPDTYQLMRQIEDEHWWFAARRNIIGALLDRLNLPAQAEFLEVGCGTGGNIALLKRFGAVTCIELDKIAAKIARDRNLAPVLHGKLPDELPELSRQFDVITLFDVIEHVKEDGASLQVLAPLLKSGGRIVITVPAFNFLWSQHDDENHHQRRYRRRDLAGLAQHCGLTLDYISYFNFWLFPPVAGVRLIRKVLPYQESWQDMRKPNEVVNRVLQSVFSSERHVVGRMSLPFGISLIAVMSVSGGASGPDSTIFRH
jgi:SAM-dependent methyltransferase